MKAAILGGALVSLLLIGEAGAVDPTVVKELAPTGTLRIGVAYAPAPSPVFVVADASGSYRGVPRDLGLAMAEALGVTGEIVARPGTGELTEALAAGTLDIGFMPVDDERRKRLDFSPPYFIVESTYLVAANSGIAVMADVDRPEITVVGIAGTTTVRAAGRSLSKAQVVLAKGVIDAVAMLKAGDAQALALSRDSLLSLQPGVPGSRIVDGYFQKTGVGAAIGKGRPAALAFIKEFIETAKANGLMRRAFDDVGLNQLPIAPAVGE